jgi:hypothetical protein
MHIHYIETAAVCSGRWQKIPEHEEHIDWQPGSLNQAVSHKASRQAVALAMVRQSILKLGGPGYTGCGQ